MDDTGRDCWTNKQTCHSHKKRTVQAWRLTTLGYRCTYLSAVPLIYLGKWTLEKEGILARLLATTWIFHLLIKELFASTLLLYGSQLPTKLSILDHLPFQNTPLPAILLPFIKEIGVLLFPFTALDFETNFKAQAHAFVVLLCLSYRCSGLEHNAYLGIERFGLSALLFT